MEDNEDHRELSMDRLTKTVLSPHDYLNER